MKVLPSLLLAPLLAACAHDAARTESPEKAASAPTKSAPAEIVLDLPGDAQHPVNLQTFVEVCQKASGWNFTYAEATGEALRASSLQLFGTKRVASADFQPFLESMLTTNGFHCEPVGPEHLHVLLITSRKT
jgi:hypothetical protein